MEKFGNVNGSSADSHRFEISNVSFSYDENEILKNINLKINHGVWGIVGESGSAKTTLIKLISRQLDVKKGDIKLDGIEIEKYSEKGYTNLVSLASQSPFVFAFSIRENLLMVKPNATEAEMWKALEDIGYVHNLKNGLDTILTENLNLSGGQLQRLNLARIFLKDTPIVLMDEATSALDNKTQADITSLIHKKKSEKIFIVIAHRVEAINDADHIIFMKDGQIEAVGSHDELLKNPEYSDLVQKKTL